MKVAIMQPYFMPYLGYFSLIKHTDLFILFDTPQYIRHGWIERNRILKLDGEPSYLKVPLQKHRRETPINLIQINNQLAWKQKILAQIVHYKKKAPNYLVVVKLLDKVFEDDFISIVDLNYKCLTVIGEYIGISTPIKIWSEMKLDINDVHAPDEWALNICNKLGAKTYYNPIGGKTFFNSEKYKKMGVNLKFLDITAMSYQQFNNEFVPFLSILDVLMFCDKDTINSMLDQVNFID